MGMYDFRQEKPGNVNESDKSGITRNPLQNEPNALKASGLSQGEIEARKEYEAYSQKELVYLDKLLKNTAILGIKGWSAEDVLKYPNVKTEVEKIIKPPLQFRNLDKHLKTLAARKK
jgi:hypothetical protein